MLVLPADASWLRGICCCSIAVDFKTPKTLDQDCYGNATTARVGFDFEFGKILTV